jgi:neopullulanase
MSRTLWFATSCMLACLSAAAQPQILKVEPPDWWAGHSVNPVRLFIHGTSLAGAHLTTSAGLTVSNVRVNPTGTYVFADVSIPSDAAPGSHPLQLTTVSGSAVVPFFINAPLTKSNPPGITRDDIVYLIMPDRFADGDTSNDDPAISKGMFDRAKPKSYHGGDFRGIRDHLPYLKDLGVTAIWMTPIYDNNNHANRDGSTDYHGYGATDLYNSDEHLGTISELRELMRAAHAIGIKVVQDQVVNHFGPSHTWVTDPPTPTWLHGTAGKHLDESWQVWTLADPYASDTIRREVTDGWFANILPDLNENDRDARQYEIQNTLWWVGTAGFDAIRQDTWPYVPRDFWHDWMGAIKRQFPSLTVVGEVFEGDPALVSFFQGGQERNGVDTLVDTLFDYPVYFQLRKAFAQGGSLIEVPKMIAHDRLYPDPNVLWTFLGNHDVNRFLNEKQADAASFQLALTALFTIRGIPLLYYGDEIGMPGGDDPDNRQDFPGGWLEDARNAFLPSGRSAAQSAMFDFTRKLAHLRASLPALRLGSTRNLIVQDQVWVFARYTSGSAVVVAINNGTTPASLNIPLTDLPIGDGTVLQRKLSAGAPISVNSGQASLTLPAKSAELLIPE